MCSSFIEILKLDYVPRLRGRVALEVPTIRALGSPQEYIEILDSLLPLGKKIFVEYMQE